MDPKGAVKSSRSHPLSLSCFQSESKRWIPSGFSFGLGLSKRTSSSPYSELITRNSLLMRAQFPPCEEMLRFDEELVREPPPLDIRSINVSLKRTFCSFMSRVKKQLSALSLLFSLEILSLGFFANGTFSWSTQHVLPLLKVASHTDAGAVTLDSPAKTDGR